MKFYKIISFSFNHSHANVISPKEIKKTIKKLQARAILSSFSNYQTFGKWKTNNEAIDIFKTHVANINSFTKLNLYQEEQIFHDLKLLLNNLVKRDTNKNDEIYFFTELLSILQKIYVENFRDIEFISNNLSYGLSSFIFLKHLCENEFLIQNTNFLKDLFSLIEKTTVLLVEDLYLRNKNAFIQNIHLMDEFMNKLSMIIRNRYISSYNPIFYKTEFNEYINKIFMKFENYFLHICLNYPLKSSQEKIKNFSDLLFGFEIHSERSIDYVNMFLLNHKTQISTFFLIDILANLSKYRQVNNYLILNCLYSRLFDDIKDNMIKIYPKAYLINTIYILSKNSVLGSFVIVETFVKALIDKTITELNYKEISNIIVSCCRVRYVDKGVFEILFNSMNKCIDISYITIRYTKTLLDRLMTEEYINKEFIELVYNKCSDRFEDLKAMLKPDNKIDIEEFRLFIKDEIIRTKDNILLDTITVEDYVKYASMCQNVILHCLFKLKKGYRCMSSLEFIFINENDKEELFTYINYGVLMGVDADSYNI
jgi:hypothetical protein